MFYSRRQVDPSSDWPNVTIGNMSQIWSQFMIALHDHFEGKTHIIWDWNGTLLGDLDLAIRVVNRLLLEENLPEITLEGYKKAFGFPVIDYYVKLGFDTSPAKFHDLCERFNEYFHAGLDGCDLWPSARATLAFVRSSGRTQSLLSASQHQLLVESVKRFGVDSYFDHVVGIADKKAGSKVERGHELMARAGHPPANTLLIGDTDHDLEVGDALGIDVILVDHGHQCETRLKAKHHRVLKVL